MLSRKNEEKPIGEELVTSWSKQKKNTWNKKLLSFFSLTLHVKKVMPPTLVASCNPNPEQLSNLNVGSLQPKTLPLDSSNHRTCMS
jgi:hypothetical protein